MKLTDAIAKAAPATGSDHFLWDDMPGFGLRVSAAGHKAWCVQYRVGGRGTRGRRKTLGPIEALKVREARDRAQQLIAGRRNDPIEAERAAGRDAAKAETVGQLCDRYELAVAAGLVLGKRGQPKKPSTIATDRGRIARHIKPLLGKRLVGELTGADVRRFINDVTIGRTKADERTGPRGRAVVTGGAGTATRTVGLLSGILAFARDEGTIATNPAHGVRKPRAGAKTTRLDPAGYATLGDALVRFETGGGSAEAVAIIRLLAFTGCRKGEIEALRASEIDLRGSALRLADSKTGRSVRPLGSPAVAILAGRTVDPIFPSPRAGRPYRGLRNAWRVVVGLAGPALGGRVTLHTLRHSFASTAADLGYSEPTIAALIGHAGTTVTSRYVHHLDDVLIKAADRVAKVIEGQMHGEAANVVPLRAS